MNVNDIHHEKHIEMWKLQIWTTRRVGLPLQIWAVLVHAKDFSYTYNMELDAEHVHHILLVTLLFIYGFIYG